jgi:NAD-dependent dihydropyrimidine dehydrogenase PreA subunit
MRYLLSGHALVLDEARCNGCGRCVEVCPHAVFTISRRKAVIASRDTCMECGACRTNCAPGAIQVAAGVGCAVAVINQMLSRKPAAGASCACG